MRRCIALLGSIVLVLATAPPVGAAAPSVTIKTGDSLYVEYDTVPNLDPGVHQWVDILLSHAVWATDGVVTNDWTNFEVYVGRYEWTTDVEHPLPGKWAGGYFQPNQNESIAFRPRSVSGSRTLTWRCLTGICPTMPATIDVAIFVTAVGAPRVNTVTGPGSPGPTTGVAQMYDAVVTMDTGGAITLPPLISWSTLAHGWTRTVTPMTAGSD